MQQATQQHPSDAQLSPRRHWHRHRIEQFSRIRRAVRRLAIMGPAKCENALRARKLRRWKIDGRDRFGTVPPRGAWELFELIAGVRAWRDDDGQTHYEGLQAPWRVLAPACGCSADQLARYAVPWLITMGLLVRVYAYERARDGHTLHARGGRRRRRSAACVFWLDSGGEALVKQRAQVIAGARERRKNSDPNDCCFSLPREASNQPREIARAIRVSAGVEGAAAAPPRKVVHVETVRRRLPPELRQHERAPLGKVRPLRGRVDKGKAKARGHRGQWAAAPPAALETCLSGNSSPAKAPEAAPPAADPPPAPQRGGGGGGDDGGDDRDRARRLALRAMRGDQAAAAELLQLGAELDAAASRCSYESDVAGGRAGAGGATGAGVDGAPLPDRSPPAAAVASLYDGCSSQEDEETREAEARRRNAAERPCVEPSRWR